MSLRLITLVWLLASATCSYGQADEADTKHLARFLSDQTMMVGKIDVSRIDVAASFDLLLGMKLPVEDELQQSKARLMFIRAALVEAGVERLYLAYNQMELFQWPVVYVPLKDTAQAEQVASLIAHGQSKPFPRRASWMTPGGQADWKVIDNYVVVGSAGSFQTLASAKQVKRADFQAALAALKDAPVQALILPTADLRKVIAETMPQFPKELGQGSTAVLSKGVQWAVITAGLPPKLQAQLIVQTEQPSQALELQMLWKLAMGTLKKETDAVTASNTGKAFYQLVNSIDVSVKHNRFMLDAGEERVSGITRILVQSLALNAGDDLNASNLRQFVIAMHNFHADFDRLPNHAILSKDEKPLLSWRVALLPYLGQDHLYKQFKMDEPWDSEHNKKLIEKMPKIFAHPSAKNVPAHHTLYQVFYSKKGAKPAAVIMETGRMTLGMLSMQDGTSNTFMVTDAAAEAVPWTKPADLLYDGTEANLPKLVSPRGNEWAHVGMGDGSVRRFKVGCSPKLLWQMIGRNDGFAVDMAEVFGEKR